MIYHQKSWHSLISCANNRRQTENKVRCKHWSGLMYVSRWISVFGELRWLARLFDPSYMDNFCLLCWSIMDQLHLTFSSQITFRCQDVIYACQHGTPVIVSNNRNNGLIISLSHDNKLISQDNEIINSWSWNQNHLQTLPFSASIIFLLLCYVHWWKHE